MFLAKLICIFILIPHFTSTVWSTGLHSVIITLRLSTTTHADGKCYLSIQYKVHYNPQGAVVFRLGKLEQAWWQGNGNPG